MDKHKQTVRRSAATIWVLTGFFLILLCAAVSVALCLVPYEKAETYLHIAFMDQSMKITPASSLDGLVITEHEIPTGEAQIAGNPEDAGQASQNQFYSEGEIIRPAFAEQYAVLSCEDISLSVPVYWGSSPELLDLGACQSSSSVVLGETGNVVIDAHINTFFADLPKLQPGNQIVLYTTYGRFTYAVTEQVQFQNTDKKYVLPTDTDRLTLYTCEAQVLGTSSSRIGFLCDLVSKQFYQPLQEETP